MERTVSLKLRTLLTATLTHRVLMTATALGVAAVAGHGFLGLLAILVYAWASSMMAAGPGNTAKTRNIEDRLNAAMPRVPWPQASTGPAFNGSAGPSNNSYGPANTSYTSGNSSYAPWNISYTAGNNSYFTSAGVSGTDTAWTANQGGGSVDPWPHAHTMYHSHNLGSFQTDFNTLRQSYTDTVNAFNNHITDHGNLVNTVSALRASHSDTVSAFNNHIGDHGNLVSTVSTLRQSHSDLVSTVSTLRQSHSDLITQHNAVVTQLQSANVFT